MPIGGHWSIYGDWMKVPADPIVAFTGHRPDKLGGYSWSPIQEQVCRAIRWRLLRLRPSVCISGMALGVDQWAASICVELGIPFVAYIPFKGQESNWPARSRAEYERLLAKAERVRVVCDGEYSPRKMQERNVAMVLDSDVLFAVWDGTDGGTGNCFKFCIGIQGWTGKDCPSCRGCGEKLDKNFGIDRACSACGGTGEEYGFTPIRPIVRYNSRPTR